MRQKRKVTKKYNDMTLDEKLLVLDEDFRKNIKPYMKSKNFRDKRVG